jgi:hypothetical protein
MASRSQRRRTPARLGCAFLAAAGLWALIPATAPAAIVTVGSPLTSSLIQTDLGSSGPLTAANVVIAEPGTNVASPVDGIIVRWKVSDFSGGPFYLRVLRPVGPTVLSGAGTSAPATPLTMGTETFPTSLPIKKGDIIGFNTTKSTDKVGAAPIAGSSVSAWSPVLADGATGAPIGTSPAAEIAFSAEIIPAPVITALKPASGSIAGGTKVTIVGENLSGATALSFGSQAGAVFPATSDTEVTAVAPTVKKPSVVDIAVTTPSGVSATVTADKFTYKACTVPQLKGKTLKSAKKKLKKAGCKLGKVKGEKSGSAKVKKQGPKAGKVLALGAKVNITLDG